MSTKATLACFSSSASKNPGPSSFFREVSRPDCKAGSMLSCKAGYRRSCTHEWAITAPATSKSMHRNVFIIVTTLADRPQSAELMDVPRHAICTQEVHTFTLLDAGRTAAAIWQAGLLAT